MVGRWRKRREREEGPRTQWGVCADDKLGGDRGGQRRRGRGLSSSTQILRERVRERERERERETARKATDVAHLSAMLPIFVWDGDLQREERERDSRFFCAST